MNVQPGQLARVVVAQQRENLQAIVHVERACSCFQRGAGWWICTNLQTMYGAVDVFIPPIIVQVPPGQEIHLHDSCLRPLGGPGEDEMLRITGKPNETPVDVINEVRA